MNKSTKMTGVDCKIGRKSRTGSTVTMSVPDEFVLDCVNYFKDIDSGEEPTGKIRRIELVMYDESDMEEAETIESLRAENKEMREQLENLEIKELSTKEIDPSVNSEPIEIELVEKEETLPANQPDLRIDGPEDVAWSR